MAPLSEPGALRVKGLAEFYIGLCICFLCLSFIYFPYVYFKFTREKRFIN